MLIAVDLHGLGGPGTGLTRYAQGLLRHWLADTCHHFRIFCPAAHRACYADLPISDRVHWHWAGDWSEHALKDLAWHQTGFPATALSGCDVLFTAVDRRLPAWSPIPVVGTVHDLAPFVLSGKYGASRDVFSRHVLPRLMRRADRLIAVSHATATDLASYLGITAEQVTVVPNGIDATRFAHCSPTHLGTVRARLGLTRPFALYPGRLEHPGKNHVGAIAAAMAADIDLVCVGRPWMQVEAIRAAAAQHPGRVHLIGWLPDDDLVALYHSALALFFPSRHEGFGLPILEAFAAGCPVVCSTAGALPEVAGDAALMADADDHATFTTHLIHLRKDSILRQHLRERGFQRVESFTWKATAAQTLATLEAIAAAR